MEDTQAEEPSPVGFVKKASDDKVYASCFLKLNRSPMYSKKY